MIITSASLIPSDDLTRACWNGIRRFHNVSYVSDLIFNIHNISKKHNSNVRKQAEQIKYCLVQAKEYYDAARAVSLATKPVLMYYSIMSLALAEILLKQDGESSLDMARTQHAHHGLIFHLDSKKDHYNLDLGQSATCLRASPHVVANKHFGTFELWHRGSRELPIVGKRNFISPNGAVVFDYNVVMHPRDERPNYINEDGITLLGCLQHMPSMCYFITSCGVKSLIVRGNIVSNIQKRPPSDTKEVIIHPHDTDVLESFYSQIRVRPSCIDMVSITELESGLIIRFTITNEHPVHMSFPPSATLSKEEVMFCSEDHPLNEFGLFYVALYIVGNYARYFPDKWLVDIDRASHLALVVEELLAQAEQRVPLLALSELSRKYLVPD